MMKPYGILPSERDELAQLIEVHEQYLYQCLTKKKDMEARLAADAEVKTRGRLRRWMLRRDWPQVWPELVGAEGAPPVHIAEVPATPGKASAITGKVKKQRAGAKASDAQPNEPQTPERRKGQRRGWRRDGSGRRELDRAEG